MTFIFCAKEADFRLVAAVTYGARGAATDCSCIVHSYSAGGAAKALCSVHFIYRCLDNGGGGDHDTGQGVGESSSWAVACPVPATADTP